MRLAWSALVVWTVAELESPVSTDLAKAIFYLLFFLICFALPQALCYSISLPYFAAASTSALIGFSSFYVATTRLDIQ